MLPLKHKTESQYWFSFEIFWVYHILLQFFLLDFEVKQTTVSDL